MWCSMQFRVGQLNGCPSMQTSELRPGATVWLGKWPHLTPGKYGFSRSASLGCEEQEEQAGSNLLPTALHLGASLAGLV